MRRTLAILKYVPAVLCGLLVVVWVKSEFTEYFLEFPVKRDTVIISANAGSIECLWAQMSSTPRKVSIHHQPSIRGPISLGRFRCSGIARQIWLPIPFLLTLLLPLTIGPFTRFRFPLWSYFAWTALIAAELAYYLANVELAYYLANVELAYYLAT